MALVEIRAAVGLSKAVVVPSTAGDRRVGDRRAADHPVVGAAIHLEGAYSRVRLRGRNSHFRTPARSITHSVKFTDVVLSQRKSRIGR